jgi:RNA polymerase sigma-70 factor (ECF subfamily)
MYEEKSTEEIASQVGLSENATRQLIFRARAAFKKALIGDVDTTGMSAAAILSVAARKAASEGKKVGAAALTLIALVVMSVTVFPGLNGAPSDQMAEAPVNPGSSSEADQSSGTSESTGDQNSSDQSDAAGSESDTAETPGTGSSDTSGTPAQVSAAPSQTASAKSEIEEVKAVLRSPSLGSIYNSDSMTKVLVFDQNYTALGDNGLIARFTFNPNSDQVFTDISIEIDIDNYFFDFKPSNTQVISGKYAPDQDVYILVGDATYVYDEFGRTWSKSDLGKSRIKIEVIMEPNGSTVKSISLVMLGR